MRTVFLICFSTALFCTACNAQSKISWGVQAKLGSSISSYRPDITGTSIHYLTFPGAGIYADIPINDHFSFRPQVGWMRKGYRLSFPALGGTPGVIQEEETDAFKLDYVPLDFTFVYRIRPGKAFHPFVQAGVRGNTLISSRIVRVSDRPSSAVDFDGNKRFTVGGLVAAGVEWRRLALSFEVNQDFNTYLGENGAATPDFRPTFRWFGFNLAYQLGGI